MSTNYYQILDLKLDASPEEIKKSYRKLAKVWHPDRNNNSPESVSKFKLISEAYQVLGNKRTREDYDEQLKYGNMTVNGHPYNNPMDMFDKIFMNNLHKSYDVFDTPFFQTDNDVFQYGDNLFGDSHQDNPHCEYSSSSSSSTNYTIDGESYEEMTETRNGFTREVKKKNGVIISDITTGSNGQIMSDKKIKN
jgi:curved DNA-binding protein CbpA